MKALISNKVVKKTWKWQSITIAALLLGLLLTPMSNALASHNGYGFYKGPRVTVKDTVNWWRWAFGIPSSVHPLSLKNEIDPTGKNFCMVGQHGRTWNLGGIFKVIDPVPAELAQSTSEQESNGFEPVVIERECRIPLGQDVLIPVLNVECNTAEEVALDNLDPDASFLEKAIYLRKDCVKPVADAVTVAEAFFGPEGRYLKEVKVQRVATIQAVNNNC